MLILYVQAPFAAFRTFSAGWYRPTAAFLTPSAAYGLALNVAGIETRRDDGLSSMTVTQFGLPSVRIALGAVPGPHGRFPSVHTLFQQLHNYPVGSSGKDRKDETKGNKYNITPVRREFLADLRACVVLDGNPDLEHRIQVGLSTPLTARYGLPFLGDNAFLIDKLEARPAPPISHWYCHHDQENDVGTTPHTTRLSIWIDRQDMSKTRSALFAPQHEATTDIPREAWTTIDPPPIPSQGDKAKKRGKT